MFVYIFVTIKSRTHQMKTERSKHHEPCRVFSLQHHGSFKLLQTDLPTYLPTYLPTCVPTYLPTYVPSYYIATFPVCRLIHMHKKGRPRQLRPLYLAWKHAKSQLTLHTIRTLLTLCKPTYLCIPTYLHLPIYVPYLPSLAR